MTDTSTVSTVRDKLVEILDSNFRLSLKLVLDEDIPNAADDIIEALTEMGRLLPEGGKRRTEYGVRVDKPHPSRKEKAGTIMTHFPEANARHAPKIWDGWTLVQRTVIKWPDGSSYTGRWVEVEPVETDGAAA